MVELLKQPQYRPMHVVDQVMSIFAGTRGHLDFVPINEVPKWEREFLDYVHREHQSLWDDINAKKALDDELMKRLAAVLTQFNEVSGYTKPLAESAV
jgi:F-type H+-transporting ATPase subunit alpha